MEPNTQSPRKLLVPSRGRVEMGLGASVGAQVTGAQTRGYLLRFFVYNELRIRPLRVNTR